MDTILFDGVGGGGGKKVWFGFWGYIWVEVILVVGAAYGD